VIHVVLDIQHAGNPARPTDMGASYDLDGDGVRGENGEREVDMVRGYVPAATDYLRALGHRVTILESGTYAARHATAIRIARADPAVPVLYAACHTNAGGGAYGLLRPDYRSRRGLSAAGAIGFALAEHLPELSTVRIEPLYPNAATAAAVGKDVSTAQKVAWWTRGWSCIDGIYSGPANLCGLLVEPAFLDSAAHRGLWTPDGLTRIGEAIASGIHAWTLAA
jgi:hypothetical protein